MKIYTYVDNSNLYIEGTRISAVKQGLASNIFDAMNNGIVDRTWQIDYGKLHAFLCGTLKSEIGGARLWGSPPPSDTFWGMVKSKGFDVETFDKSRSGREKKVDVAIAHRMTKDAYTIIKKEDELTLVAGDKDFVPVVEDLTLEGFKVVVMFWGHAAQELKDVSTSFINLDSHFQYLTFNLN